MGLGSPTSIMGVARSRPHEGVHRWSESGGRRAVKPAITGTGILAVGLSRDGLEELTG